MADRVDLALAQRLANEATPGPWRWAYPGSDQPVLMGIQGDENYSYETEVLEATHDHGCACRRDCTMNVTVEDKDAEFIAASRSLVPALVAELVGLREATNRIRQEHRPVKHTDVSLSIVDETVCFVCHGHLDEPADWPEDDDSWPYPLVQLSWPCPTVAILDGDPK